MDGTDQCILKFKVHVTLNTDKRLHKLFGTIKFDLNCLEITCNFYIIIRNLPGNDRILYNSLKIYPPKSPQNFRIPSIQSKDQFGISNKNNLHEGAVRCHRGGSGITHLRSAMRTSLFSRWNFVARVGHRDTPRIKHNPVVIVGVWKQKVSNCMRALFFRCALIMQVWGDADYKIQ